MYDKLNKINLEIKATWKKFFRNLILFTFIIMLAFYLFEVKKQKYINEYKSTTWYEEIAYFNHSKFYQVREEKNDSYEYVDYYDWYFTYKGKDGNTYEYIEKKQSYEPSLDYSTTIYVDINDNSHSLEIKSFEDDDLAKRIVIIILCGPYIIAYFITFIILYTRKYIVNKRINKLNYN